MSAIDDGGSKRPGRYRKVEVRTWGDERFRQLSAMPPSGQGLWLYLITGPHTGPIPGLFRAGRAAMAEELGWAPEQFEKRFQEPLALGMVQADFSARVMWIPNAIKHNRPDNPNVIKGWAAEFDLIPECALKCAAWKSLRASVYALGEQFGKAFDDSLPNPSMNRSANGSANGSGNGMPNQEQEQEQEQEQLPGVPPDPLPAARAASSSAKPKTRAPRTEKKKTSSSATPTIPCPYQRIVDSYHDLLPDLPRVRLDTEARHKSMRKLWAFALTTKRSDNTPRARNADEALAWIRSYWQRAADNDFLMGRRQMAVGSPHANWRCDFDFLLTERGMKHVIEKTEPKEAT